MNDPEIIRAVAEFDGWKETKLAGIAHIFWERAERGPGNCIPTLPPYLTSLDAIVPVCEKLDRNQQEMFENALWALLPGDENHGPMTDGGEDVLTPRMFTLANATARQRCIALVKTLGLWTEDET